MVGVNPALPHISYGDGSVPTVFKAVATGGVNASYTFDWDVNGDGIYEISGQSSSDGNLQGSYVYSDYGMDRTFAAVVRDRVLT